MAFLVVGFLTPMEWTRLGPENYLTPVGLVAGAMLILLNCEGFELIANASKDVANPRRHRTRNASGSEGGKRRLLGDYRQHFLRRSPSP